MLPSVFPLLGALDGDGEDGVRPGADGIHVGGPNASVPVTHRHQLVHVVRIVDHEHAQVLDVHPDVGPLFDFQTNALVFTQQVTNLEIGQT